VKQGDTLVSIGGCLFGYLASNEFFEEKEDIMLEWEQKFLDEVRKDREFTISYELVGVNINSRSKLVYLLIKREA
jgi:hypothetical protein